MPSSPKNGGGQKPAPKSTAAGGGAPRPSADKTRFPMLTFSELAAEPQLPFVIDQVLPAGALGVIYGAPGSAKSFVALDTALCTSAGLPWIGFRTVPGPVVYVAAERYTGIRQRVQSWLRHHQLKDAPRLYFVPEPVQLLEPSDVHAFVRALRALPCQPALIVMDTLSRCIVGADENGQRDMTMAIAALDDVRRETGAAILLIHHSRKDDNRERGSTVLRGAADAMILVNKEQDLVTVSSTKANDVRQFDKIKLQLEPVESSCVLVPLVPDPSSPASETALPPEKRAWLAALLSHPAGLSVRRWSEIADVARSTVGNWSKDARKKGWIKATKTGFTLTESGRAVLA